MVIEDLLLTMEIIPATQASLPPFGARHRGVGTVREGVRPLPYPPGSPRMKNQRRRGLRPLPHRGWLKDTDHQRVGT